MISDFDRTDARGVTRYVGINDYKADTPRRSWAGRILSVDKNVVNASIYIASNESIGDWSLRFAEEERRGEEKRVIYSIITPIYILFNPWSECEYMCKI